MNTKPFTPSTGDLLRMIRAAEEKCDADIAQAKFRREAQADLRMARAIFASTSAISAARRFA